MTSISARKKEHLDIASGSNAEGSVAAGWDDIRLVPVSLPASRPDDLDLTVELAGFPLAAPLMVAGMTGGHADAVDINERIATVAGELGLAIGSGSQRAALRDPSLTRSFTILREAAPNAVIAANIGVCQLVPQEDGDPLGPAEIEEIVGMLDAQLLAVHLNAIEELIQPEGDRNVGELVDAIGQLVDQSPVPIIAKETGSGMSRATATLLVDAGVAAIDVGGAGGTSFALIEGQRAQKRGDRLGARLGAAFGDWGIPTAISLLEVKSTSIPKIATGGIRSGLDAAKALALGASISAVGRPVLIAARQGADEVRFELESLLTELRVAVALTGATSAGSMHDHQPVVLGDVAAWATQRGLL